MKKLLIANRGEIALRVMKACRQAGIQSVAVYSEADRHSRHVWMADESVCIGPPAPSESYLNIQNILLAAKAKRADAIHPGYGFLAENSAFANACVNADIKFVGPSAEIISCMGDKVKARTLAIEAGIPIVPGSDGYNPGQLSEAKQKSSDIGFPLLLKAAAGGGGRGMRVVRQLCEFDKEFMEAAREAESAFGDNIIYMERYFDKARHIEVQVLSDREGTHIHLGVRDCTLQRRHQKLVEESPSPALTADQEDTVCKMTIALTKTINYENAGTVEFLYDTETSNFYFIEMNTRIQVEHPVTEMVTGIDVVLEQLRIASGKDISQKQSNIKHWKYAIEWRINAEDASRGFMPSPGTVRSWEHCDGIGVRLDSHVYPGYSIPIQYDSLLGKLIIGGNTREEAMARSKRILSTFKVKGVHTTIPFYLRLLDQPEFLKGEIHTRWIDENIERIFNGT